MCHRERFSYISLIHEAFKIINCSICKIKIINSMWMLQFVSVCLFLRNLNTYFSNALFIYFFYLQVYELKRYKKKGGGIMSMFQQKPFHFRICTPIKYF